MNESKVKEHITVVQECFSKWKPLFDEMKDDYRMKLGDQWKDEDAAYLQSKGRPALVINHTKKQIDTIAGHQRQNSADIKVFPVEADDEQMAEIYSKTIKWTMNNMGANYYASLAFEDAITGGIGWLAPDMEYHKDMLNGDIIMKRVSPFRVMIDPFFEDPLLTDAEYVIYFNYITKQKAKAIYPQFAGEIDSMSSAQSFGVLAPTGDLKGKVLVSERWYRTYEKRKFLVNLTTGDVLETTQENADAIAQAIQVGMQNGYQYDEIQRDVPVMRNCTVLNDRVLVEDGVAPVSMSMFPYIPILSYYDASYNDLKWKIQGLVRCLKDPQREKNKLRSKFMAAVNTMPFGKIAVEKGSIDSPQALLNNEDANEIIEVNQGKSMPQQIMLQQFPAALFQLEQNFSEEMRTIGMNADLLGIMQEKGAAGVTVQLRQKQGITSIQALFDNLSQSKRMLGKYMIELINQNYTPEKLQRITGMQVPEDWDIKKENSYFDCYVDEIAESETYRAGNFLTLQTMAQQGMPIPPEMLVMASPMSGSDKEQLLGMLQQQQSQTDPAAEAQVQEIQAKIEKMAAEIEKLSAETTKIQTEVVNMPGGAQIIQQKKAEQEALQQQQLAQQQQEQAMNAEQQA